jgi:hypothetical protein
MLGGMGLDALGCVRRWMEGGVRTSPKHRDHRLHVQASSASPKTWQTLVCPLVQKGFGWQ